MGIILVFAVSKQVRYLKAATAASTAIGIALCHETSRGGILGSSWNVRAILTTVTEVQVHINIAEWVAAAGRLFGALNGDEQWWPDLLGLISTRCALMSAGVSDGITRYPCNFDDHQYQSMLSTFDEWWASLLNGCASTISMPGSASAASVLPTQHCAVAINPAKAAESHRLPFTRKQGWSADGQEVRCCHGLLRLAFDR